VPDHKPSAVPAEAAGAEEPPPPPPPPQAANKSAQAAAISNFISISIKVVGNRIYCSFKSVEYKPWL
jgi:hypothetical protein